ncbi:MAG: DbpA RNA binding domain-containing protein [Spirochaetes bacterium]|nr:DbpA RNA binding domain-containing protein [Spirochaetota bacterium]
MNQQKKKISRVLEIAMTEDLSMYGDLLKAMKKSLGLPFFGTRKVAAALLKELIGDISGLDYSADDFVSKGKDKLVFEDVKDGKVRLFANVGKQHKAEPGDLIREIVKRSGIDGKNIGKIDIHQSYSFIEIPEQYAEVVLLSFENVRFRGVRMVLEPARRKKKEQ